MSSKPRYELILDSKDVWSEHKEVFHLRPEKAHFVSCFENGTFNCCSVYNTNVEDITPRFLKSLYDKLLPNSNVEVVVYQPISVMQEFDAKQIEANAKCCGFTKIKIVPNTIDSKELNFNTLAVIFTRPEKSADEYFEKIETNLTDTFQRKVLNLKISK